MKINFFLCFIAVLIIASSYYLSIMAQGGFLMISLIGLGLIILLNELIPKCIIAIKGNQDNAFQQWLMLLENSVMAMVIVESDGRIVKANRESEKLLVITPKEAQNILEQIDDEYRQPLLNAAAEENDGCLEINLNTKGNLTPVLCYYTPILYNKNHCLLLQIIDMTPYKTVIETKRTAQKMQDLGQFACSVAHDFNNVLTAIMGFCDILLSRHQMEDPSFAELMHIKQNTTRAATLSKQILTFAKEGDIKQDILNISDAITDVLGLMLQLLGPEIQCNIVHKNEGLLATINKVQFEQIIINLIVNAKDAMHGKGKLFITTQKIKVDKSFPQKNYLNSSKEPIGFGEYALLEIRDTGDGISEAIMDKIFEPFFSTKSPDLGTGLGLATVIKIVDKVGGYLRLKTESNVGTTFFVFLKLTEEPKIK